MCVIGAIIVVWLGGESGEKVKEGFLKLLIICKGGRESRNGKPEVLEENYGTQSDGPGY